MTTRDRTTCPLGLGGRLSSAPIHRRGSRRGQKAKRAARASVESLEVRRLHAAVIHEFPITTASGPTGITAGPDGNLWFTENTANRIGRITPAGVVTDFNLTAGSGPKSITAGPDGNLWFTEFNGSRIGRITTDGVVSEFSAGITPGCEPEAITAGPDGNLWFTEASPTLSGIGRITTTGAVTEFRGGIGFNCGPGGITAGPDGNLWFTETSSDKIGQVTTAGVITEFGANIPAGSGPAGIAAGPDGNLWFTEFGSASIGKITTAGVVTQFSTGITANSRPEGIAAGPDGNLWFTEQAGNQVAQITPDGVVTEYSSGISPNSSPYGITAAPGGRVWFSENLGDKIGSVSGDLLTVTNTNDSGNGSLRQAVSDANNAPVGGLPVQIGFNIPGSGVQVIQLHTPLNIFSHVNLDGTTQPGYAGTPVIYINQGSLSVEGLLVYAAGTAVQGIATAGNPASAEIVAVGPNVTFFADLVGTNAAGTAANPTSGGPGIEIGGSSDGDTIEKCVVSGNADGIDVDAGADNTLIKDDYIGTDFTGKVAIPNRGVGILLQSSGDSATGDNISNNQAGGVVVFANNGASTNNNEIRSNFVSSNGAPGITVEADNSGASAAQNNDVEGNTVVANTNIGIGVFGTPATDTIVKRNFVGWNPNDPTNLADGNGYGIGIFGGLDTVVGGVAGDGNVVALNLFDGIFNAGSSTVVKSNFVGAVPKFLSVLNSDPTAVNATDIIPALNGGAAINEQDCSSTTIADNLIAWFAGQAGVLNGTLPGSGNVVTGGVFVAPNATSLPIQNTLFNGNVPGGPEDVPVLKYAVETTYHDVYVNGRLNGVPGKKYTINVYFLNKELVAKSAGAGVVIVGADGTVPFNVYVGRSQPTDAYVAATSTDDTSEFSAAIPITANPAAKLAFVQQPSSANSGAAIAPPVSVEVQDAGGNLVSSDNSAVTLTLSSGAFADGGTTETATAVNGVATFDGLGSDPTLIINSAGMYTLALSDAFDGITGTASTQFAITAATPALVGNPVINGDNPNGLFNAAGQPAFGTQRSMVEDVVYTFSSGVTIPNAAAAFAVVVPGPIRHCAGFSQCDGGGGYERHAVGRHPHRQGCWRARVDCQRRVQHHHQPGRCVFGRRWYYQVGRRPHRPVLPVVRRHQRQGGRQCP